METVGGQRDSNDCLIGAGYTWCESIQSCVRQWETPCKDNNQIAIDPMPPIVPTSSMPLSRPIDPPVNVCPEVMCMMYCEFGNVIDDNGCQMCQCNEALPPPITNSDCILTQPSCDDYTYVCPKMTEVTNCNMGGIEGYTTFRLSVIIKDNMNIKNIYAIYGDREGNMYLPPAYQSDTKTNHNIGGVEPFIKNLNPDTNYDSWLTIGLTDGDTDNKLSAVGIDFNEWTDTNGINIDNGGVFVMNPVINIVEGNEYILGQISVRTGTEYIVVLNIQGKTIDNSIYESWSEQNIRFNLISPQNIIHDTIPNNCKTWYDGCNTCMVNNGVLGACSKVMCFREDMPRCLQYTNGH
jgi:hypothetical protein